MAADPRTVAQRFLQADPIRVSLRFASSVRVLVDVPATLAARKKYPLFTDMIVGKFDQSITLYRIFDGKELTHILSSGKIVGGNYSVKAERDFGASWGSDISKVISWGNGQRGGRLGPDLYLAKLSAFDFTFSHLDPGIYPDANGPDEQEAMMDPNKCNTGIGCSLVNVGVHDVDFYVVRTNDQIESVSLSELKALKVPEKPAEPEKPMPVLGLKVGDKFMVTKGSNILGVTPHALGKIKNVTPVDKSVRVRLWFHYPLKIRGEVQATNEITLWANHPNRLNDIDIPLLDGRGNRVLIRKR